MKWIDGTGLRVALAEADLKQSDLAQRLKVPATTLNGWLRHRHPAPPDLRRRIEEVLGLTEGSLEP